MKSPFSIYHSPLTVCILVWLATICISLDVRAQEKIEYFTHPTLPYPPESDHAYFIDFADSLGCDTLYQERAEDGYPVSYHRKIKTSVCFNNKCRLLNIVVHWNITGRYLGFTLPSGEYLSKAEHKPFSRREYVRLHGILNDPNSSLGGFSYNELVPVKVESDADIDAVSSATAKNLLQFVVEGAAYTTYKLWHIIYGESRQEVERLTVDALTPDLLLQILESPDIVDKIWGLNHRHHLAHQTAEIQNVILSLVTTNEFSLAEAAIRTIGSGDLQDQQFQIALLQALDEANYSLKRSIIGKFKEAPEMSKPATRILADKLMEASGELVISILDVFLEKEIRDIAVCRQVATLLQDENDFVSRQVYLFLKKLSPSDDEIKQRLKKYEIRHELD